MFHKSEKGIFCAAFNQDATRLCIGSTQGYQVVKCSPNFRKIRICRDESTGLCQPYYNTGLIAHVGGGVEAGSSQRCMQITNVRAQKEIVRMSFSNKILAICINRKFLVLATSDSIRIYDMANMKLQHTISSPPANPNGVLALATCHVVSDSEPEGRHLLCYPKSSDRGDVFVYDVQNHRLLYNIEAHTSPVACASFNNKGSLLATASEKGTVIRVFSTADRTKLFELRRGMAQRAHIISMKFCEQSRFLAVSSDLASIHVFRLDGEGAQVGSLQSGSADGTDGTGATQAKEQQQGQEQVQQRQQQSEPQAEQTWTGYFTSTVGSAVGAAVGVAGYFAPSLSQMWEERRAHAIARLPANVENTSALVYEDGQLALIVFTAESRMFKFAINEKDGTISQLSSAELDMSDNPIKESLGPEDQLQK